jgi:hypothetical protein
MGCEDALNCKGPAEKPFAAAADRTVDEPSKPTALKVPIEAIMSPQETLRNETSYLEQYPLVRSHDQLAGTQIRYMV